MAIDVKRHLEEYTIQLSADDVIEIKINGSPVYTKTIPTGMLSIIDFRNSESEIEG